jgi:hypothetical protein
LLAYAADVAQSLVKIVHRRFTLQCKVNQQAKRLSNLIRGCQRIDRPISDIEIPQQP